MNGANQVLQQDSDRDRLLAVVEGLRTHIEFLRNELSSANGVLDKWRKRENDWRKLAEEFSKALTGEIRTEEQRVAMSHYQHAVWKYSQPS